MAHSISETDKPESSHSYLKFYMEMVKKWWDVRDSLLV